MVDLYKIRRKSRTMPKFKAIEAFARIVDFEVFRIKRRPKAFLLHDKLFEEYIIIEYTGRREINRNELMEYIKDIRALRMWGIT